MGVIKGKISKSKNRSGTFNITDCATEAKCAIFLTDFFNGIIVTFA